MRQLTVALALLVASARPGHADNYFTETHYELGYQSVQDAGFGGGTASGWGIHLTEHNGWLSRLPYMLFYLLAAAQTGSDYHVKGGVSSGTKESEYETKDSQGRVIDRTKIVTPTTTLSMELVPLTAEEKRLRDENLERLGASLAIFAMLPSHFEMMYAPQRDDGRLHGIRGALYPVAISIGRHFELALGYAGARFKADYADPDTGTMRTIKYRLRSIAARIGVAPARWFVATIEIQPNLLDIDQADGRYGSTLRGTATVSIPKLTRFYGKLGTERMGLGASGRWSTFFEAGMRF